MTATRSTKEERQYRKLRNAAANQGCPFCQIEPGHEQYVEETAHLKVIRNRLPYSVWDGQGVLDHLMIVPKKHTDRLGGLSQKAALEFLTLVDKYESAGYNLYARAPASTIKSVVHQHTHLLHLDGKQRGLIFLLRKPFYIRFSR